MDLSLRRPRIGYARLLLAKNTRNYSTIPGILSVITLGHTLNVPLMCLPSELSDGFEPHGLIQVSVQPAGVDEDGWVGRGCTRGGAWLGGYLEGAIPGTQPG